MSRMAKYDSTIMVIRINRDMVLVVKKFDIYIAGTTEIRLAIIYLGEYLRIFL